MFIFSKEKIILGPNHDNLKDLLSDQVASAAEDFKGLFQLPGLRVPYSHTHPSPLSSLHARGQQAGELPAEPVCIQLCCLYVTQE